MDPDGEVGRLYDVGDLPFVVLVDRAGNIRAIEAGELHADTPKAERFEAQLRELLAEKAG